jgi:predicted metal-dependent hydrolase
MKKTNQRYPQEFSQGLRLFNHNLYYEAHEAFEDAWRKTADPSREFFRALLQISGGFYRLSQDRPTAAKKFFKHADYWLTFFPETHLGVNIPDLKRNLQLIIDAIDRNKVHYQKFQKMIRSLLPQKIDK